MGSRRPGYADLQRIPECHWPQAFTVPELPAQRTCLHSSGPRRRAHLGHRGALVCVLETRPPPSRAVALLSQGLRDHVRPRREPGGCSSTSSPGAVSWAGIRRLCMSCFFLGVAGAYFQKGSGTPAPLGILTVLTTLSPGVLPFRSCKSEYCLHWM